MLVYQRVAHIVTMSELSESPFSWYLLVPEKNRVPQMIQAPSGND